MRLIFLNDVYRTTVLTKVLYCSPAWSSLDLSLIDTLLRQSKRLGYCYVNTPPVADLLVTSDGTLFDRIITMSPFHVLQPLLPDHFSHHYNIIGNRWNHLQLTQKTTHLTSPEQQTYH